MRNGKPGPELRCFRPGFYEFEDELDSNQLITTLKLQLKHEIRGDDLWLDFWGHPPQVRGGLNMVFTA